MTPIKMLSIIIPVYNRVQEIHGLLQSITEQTFKNFQVIIVEDGSVDKCEHLVSEFEGKIGVKYYFIKNVGAGLARNYGMNKANGDFFIFLDSDCILPSHYLQTVINTLNDNTIDAYGGPDKAHHTFTYIQKAINYSMTSFLTTGGIRGNSKKRMENFHPRSFNMGYSREVYNTTGGFSSMVRGQDIEMSIRIYAAKFRVQYIPEAYVYHKRRIRFKIFFKQAYNSGIARINLLKRHAHTLKLVHTLPSFFLFGVVITILLFLLVSPLFLIPIGVYMCILGVDATIKNGNVIIGILSILSSMLQLIGYGSGFLYGFWNRYVLRKKEFYAFTKTFYK